MKRIQTHPVGNWSLRWGRVSNARDQSSEFIVGKSVIINVIFTGLGTFEKIGGMMRRYRSWLTIISILLLGTAVCSQGAEIKMGMIDFQVAIEKSQAGQKMEAEWKKEGERMEAELTKDKEELTALKEKLEREAMVMSREAREEKEIEFRVKARNLQEKEKRYREEFIGKQRQEVGKIQKVVVEIAQELGKKEGFTMVLNKVGVVIYHDSAVDLTDRVVQLLDQRLATKSAQ